MKGNFAAYIQAQKMRIRADRAGEIDFITSDGQTLTLSDGVCQLRDSEEIFAEIDSMRGLNTRERAYFAGRARAKAACAA